MAAGIEPPGPVNPLGASLHWGVQNTYIAVENQEKTLSNYSNCK